MYELDQKEFENNRTKSGEFLHSLGSMGVSVFLSTLGDIKIYYIALNIKH